jgi:lipid II:glycine glycyltransferase (peptidoglycan interpeptide bridge formation enzyme)
MMAEISTTEWDSFVAQYPNPHILQTSAWGQLKADFGWEVVHVAAQDCGAQILIKHILRGIRFAYIPKGPVGTNWDPLWPEIDDICHRRKCICLKVEPDCWMVGDNASKISTEQIPKNFVHSDHNIQPMRTLIIDISLPETEILERMKQKTRYNINLALRKNVIVRPSVDLDAFYNLMEITGQRDQFSVHNRAYYQRAYDLFHAQDHCQLFVAEFDNTPLAALIVFRNGNRAWYFYGASSNLHKDRMPNYLLQWEAIRWAKSQGCTEYDLWGVPDVDVGALETNFTRYNAGLWGVYRFKRGFGGELRRSDGPWDRIYNPMAYRFYVYWLKYRKVEG